MLSPRSLTDELCRRTGKARATIEAALGVRRHPTGKSTPRTMALVRQALREIRNQGEQESTDGAR